MLRIARVLLGLSICVWISWLFVDVSSSTPYALADDVIHCPHRLNLGNPAVPASHRVVLQSLPPFQRTEWCYLASGVLTVFALVLMMLHTQASAPKSQAAK